MDPNTQRLLQAAAGAGGAQLYIEDIFSTWLYTGNGSTQTITNGIDLAGEGGLTWIKSRESGASHALFDTARGAGYILSSDTTSASAFNSVYLSSFNSDGFSLNSGGGVINSASTNYASWTFRKAPGFFDVVTWTGSGTGTTTVPHSLGSTPGCVIIKVTNGSSPWYFQHRSLTNGLDSYLTLNTTDAAALSGSQVSANSTSLTLGSYYSSASNTYVAYLFAHDAGGFGDDGTESVIKCGSYTGNGSTSGPVIDLGWEPQWILVKNATRAVGEPWAITDTMRGIPVGGDPFQLVANASAAETQYTGMGIDIQPTGFQLKNADAWYNTSGDTFVYIAIRRGPMKTPTSGAEVFDVDAQTGGAFVTTNYPVDTVFFRPRSTAATAVASRLTGPKQTLFTNLTSSEATYAGTGILFDKNNGIEDDYYGGASLVYWSFRRAPGFFDVVAYTGTGVARTVPHNLGVAPELMIVKSRSSAGSWAVYNKTNGATEWMSLSSNNGSAVQTQAWNDTEPTDSVFTVGTAGAVNGLSVTYIAYLFATCPGVSKVGSYTGTGTTLQVDCGFASGSRLVLIKRTDSTGNWYIWDSARGIVSGNDPYLLLNSTAAEVTSTDYIDPYSAGFEISSSAPAEINASGGNFIFLAIA